MCRSCAGGCLEVRQDEVRGGTKHEKRAETEISALGVASKVLPLGILLRPYLALDLLDEGLAILILLLVLAHLLELLGGKAIELLGDLIDGQLIVISTLQCTQDSGLKLGLAGRLLGLTEDLLGVLGGLLGNPKTLAGDLLGGLQSLPGDLLGGLQPLLGGPLEGLHALLHIGQGGEKLPVGPNPTLHELDVALLKLEQLHTVGEPLLGRPGVVLLQPHELEPVVGQPDAAALGGSEVLGEGLVGIALDLCHLSGDAPYLLCVGGYHSCASVIVSHCHYVLITHIFNFKGRTITPPVVPYSPKCVEQEFSEVRI